ncbi:MAG: hypothetical protein KAH16_00275 [Candidatus Izimaplasma sp.]|nr:hypothetical protein [Candidatus Izimaplasma bacterium]
MKPSEELMLLLELNNFDILKYKLKKQLEYEVSGNLDLYRHKKYADLVVSYYLFKENEDFLHRNPLTYRTDWAKGINSIDQFIFTHPDLDGETTLKDFLALKDFNKINRESILYDILDDWVEEYRDASITQMENLREMIKLLPKKSRKYRKPSKGTFLLAVTLALFTILIFKNPTILQPAYIDFISNLIGNYNQLLYSIPWYSLFGVTSILLLVTYAVLNNALSRFIKDVRSEKNKHTERTFDKWEEDMKNSRLKQSGILEDYVDLVIKKPSKSFLDLKTLIGPEILMNKFKSYVRMIEGKFDWMTKHYEKLMKALRILFTIALIFDIAYYVVGFALIRGWISV